MVVVVALFSNSPLSGGDGGGGRSLSFSMQLSLQEERFSVCGGDGGGGRSFSLSLSP